MFKLFSKNLSKNKKGFTLVELMIVIAIIGILAIVLIPQASKMRDNAKLSGVEANMRMVQAAVEALIDDYDTPTNLATALSTKLDTSITNPFDNTEHDATVFIADAPADDGTVTSAVSVAIIRPSTTTSFTAAANTYFAASGTNEVTDGDLSGSVVVAIYGTGKTLKAEIYGYDKVGKPMTSSAKIKTVAK